MKKMILGFIFAFSYVHGMEWDDIGIERAIAFGLPCPFFSFYAEDFSQYTNLLDWPDIECPDAVKMLHIEQCKLKNLNGIKHLTGLKRLYLDGDNIESLPPELCDLSQLTCLSVKNDTMRSLPAEITKLTSLIELRVMHTALEKLPDDIGLLTNLRTLVLSCNQLSKLPLSLTQLTKLEECDVSRNALVTSSELKEIKAGMKQIVKNPLKIHGLY